MAQVAQLTREPQDLVDATLVAQDSTYRIQAAKRNSADVVLWDTADPPGGPTGYTLEPGQDVVIRVSGAVFYAWAFTEEHDQRFAEIVIFEAASS